MNEYKQEVQRVAKIARVLLANCVVDSFDDVFVIN